jgi:hypothetical protein
MTLDLDTLAATLDTALTAVRARAPRASARTLTVGDLRDLVTAIGAVASSANADDVRLTARLHGGFVPGSYRGAAEADYAYVEINLVTGEVVKANVARDYAQRRPHGKGEHLVLRLAREGQSDGRIVRG